MKLNLFIVLLFIASQLFAQLSVSGSIKNEEGKPIAGANVIISPIDQDLTLAFAITGKDGKYTLWLEESIHELYEVKVRAFNYAFVSDLINESSEHFDFVLTEKPIELQEVKIKASPIRKRGDTIAYDVSNFKDIQDRSIADVIKKMPGIEIESSGRILYQGEPINKYYIEGLDLLGGRYALANENMSADAVDKVQILENHQSVKILDSLVYSSRAALNIKLKDKVTYSGKAEIGAGFSPTLYQVNLTPMMFTKNQQVLASIQSNNRGENLQRQINVLSLEDLLNDNEKYANNSWLLIAGVQTPHFESKRWLHNAATLGTWNQLIRIKKDIELRVNVDYLNDYQQHQGDTHIEYFLPTGNLVLNELKRNNFQRETLKTKFTLQQNTQKNYFQNILEFKGDWHRDHGYLTANTEFVDQLLSKPNKEFSNQLNWIKTFGKQLVTFKSLIAYKDYHEQLSIKPGVFIDVVNDEEAYDLATQNLLYKRMKTNHSAEFTKRLTRTLTWQSKLGMEYTWYELKSDFSTNETFNNSEFTNNNQWKVLRPNFENSLEYKKGDFRSQLVLPLHYYNLRNQDNINDLDTEYAKVFLQPRLNFNYNLSNYWNLNLNNAYLANFGNPLNFHRGYILYNYNTLRKNWSELNETESWRSHLRLKYENPIRSRFFHLIYAFDWNQNDLIYRYLFDENASSMVEAVAKKNYKTNHNFSSKISQYFPRYKTSFELNAGYSNVKSQHLLNEDLVDGLHHFLTMGAGLKFRYFSSFTLTYDYSRSQNNHRLTNQTSKVVQQNHQASVHYFPHPQHNLTLRMDYVQNTRPHKSNTLFGDFTYRYTMQKRKIDVELSVCNLFNEKVFNQTQFDQYYQMHYQYQLRPTQVMLTTRFNF